MLRREERFLKEQGSDCRLGGFRQLKGSEGAGVGGTRFECHLQVPGLAIQGSEWVVHPTGLLRAVGGALGMNMLSKVWRT